MFLINQLSSSLASSSVPSVTSAKRLTDAQAAQVAGGCTHPQGCTSPNEDVVLATLRQPWTRDFADREPSWPLPSLLSQ